MAVTLTAAAATRVKELIAVESQKEASLRVSVSGGGCSGFQYGFALDPVLNDDDHRFVQHGVGLVIDQASLELLDGATIDYVEDLMESSFRIDNPQATSTCGCGNSFSL